jgi:hypothetical protein
LAKGKKVGLTAGRAALAIHGGEGRARQASHRIFLKPRSNWPPKMLFLLAGYSTCFFHRFVKQLPLLLGALVSCHVVLKEQYCWL